MAEENNGNEGNNSPVATHDSPPSWYNTPPSWYSQQTTPPASTNSNAGTGDLSAVLSAVAAMPEKIVNAVREGTQPASRPAQQQSTQETGTQSTPPAEPQTTNTGDNKPGKKSSFGDWWFNS